MPKVDLILCPVDFSAGSEAAAGYGLWLAGRLGARVRLLHAFQGLGHAAAGVAPGLDDDFAAAQHAMRKEAERDLEALAARLREGSRAPVETEMVGIAASPAEAITRAAHAAKADLIVMGTHGRTGVRRMVLGSVAEQVARGAECPVLTVK